MRFLGQRRSLLLSNELGRTADEGALLFTDEGPGGRQMARHSEERAIQTAAAILKSAAHYSLDELNTSLADARRAILISLEEAGLDVGLGQALIEALDVAGAISQYRA